MHLSVVAGELYRRLWLSEAVSDQKFRYRARKFRYLWLWCLRRVSGESKTGARYSYRIRRQPAFDRKPNCLRQKYPQFAAAAVWYRTHQSRSQSIVVAEFDRMHQTQSRSAVAVAAAAAVVAVAVAVAAAADRTHRSPFQLWFQWNRKCRQPRKQTERVGSQVGSGQTSLPSSLVAW